MRKPGTIPPVWYFRNCTDPNHPPGYLLLAPYTGGGDRCECPTPSGYSLEYVDTLSGVDRIERILQQQEYDLHLREHVRTEQGFLAGRQAVRDRLYARMTSSSTSEFERECIRLWLLARDEKRKKVENALLCHTSYLWARHNDIGKRNESEERFDPHSVKVDVHT